MLYDLLKPALFSLDPETAHNLTLQVASLSPWMGRLSGIVPDERLKVPVGNLEWTFPIGLAAGLDKNAEALPFFTSQGFGAVEIGTVTLKAQEGNPRPRMFRYPDESSLRNAMGFPNQGLLSILPRLESYQGSVPVGANIGKNKDTTPEESLEELSVLFEAMQEEADYLVINVSSPNTPGLRALQEKSYLSELFSELNRNRTKDLYLKIAPDLAVDKIIELTQLVSDFKLTGIIATNTTIMPDRGAGGVSGVLLREKSRQVRELILNENDGIELISVGGISNPKDLFDTWMMGGKVAQVYTAYVYQGPAILGTFQKELLRFVDEQSITLKAFFALSKSERQKRLKSFRY